MFKSLKKLINFKTNVEIESVVQKLFYTQPSKSLGFCVFGLASTLFEGFGIALFLPLLTLTVDNVGKEQKGEVLFRWLFEKFNIAPTINSILLLIIIVFTIKGIFQFIHLKLRVELMTSFESRMRFDFFERLEKITYEYFDVTTKESLSAIVTSDISMASIAVQSFLTFIVRGLTAFTLMFMAFVTNPQITFLAMVLGGVAGLLLKSLSKQTSKESKIIASRVVRFNHTAIQFISGFKYFKATGNFSFVKTKIVKNIEEILNSQNKMGSYTAFLSGIQQSVAAVILTALIFVSVHYLGQDIPSILITLALIYKVISQIIGFQNEWQSFCENSGYFDHLLQIFGSMDVHQEHRSDGKAVAFVKLLELKNVNLKIGNNHILRDINMTIPHGKFIGIVGASGSGKSTLIDVFTGLRIPDSGEIQIDGIKLNNTSLPEWRKKIGFVSQEFALYGNNLVENITLRPSTKKEALSEKMIKSLQSSHAWDFITESEKSGNEIHSHHSVGQVQRIAIARELYREPDLLILDEATSALDTISESLVQTAFNARSPAQTLIFITHRLSNLNNCDLIYVLENGTVIESGSPKALMEKKHGAFKKLVDNSGELKNLKKEDPAA